MLYSKYTYSFLFVLYALIMSSLMSCNSDDQQAKCWDKMDKSAINRDEAGSDSIDVAIYLDATLSMQGFANTNGIYKKFLTDLEGSVLSGWSKAHTSFFNFGDDVHEIDRAGFLKGRYPGFYKAKHGYLHTKIDKVVDHLNKDKISVIITDLFQDEGDINAISKKVKENCFLRGLEFALICIPSDFRGNVYDVPTLTGGTTHYYYGSKSQNPESYKPFYVFIFGSLPNIKEMISLINHSCEKYISDENILIFSKRFVTEYSVVNFIHNQKVLQPLKHYDQELRNTRSLKFKEKKTGEIAIEFKINKAPYTLDFIASNLMLSIYKKRSGEPDSLAVKTNSVKAVLSSSSNIITCALELEPPSESGKFCYRVELQIPVAGAIKINDYFSNWSTDNPSSTNDANKTLGLNSFIDNLSVSYLATDKENPPKVAVAYLAITVK